MRTKLIMGNWKMHGSMEMLDTLLGTLTRTLKADAKAEYALAPPYVYLSCAHHSLKGSAIHLAAQDLSAHEGGAYTGEVSAAMLKDLGCEYVIMGHSERRQYHGESDALIAKKFKQARAVNLKPVVCIGETLEERKANNTEAVVERQLQAILAVANEVDLLNTVIAYEPVWAIGTGLAATPEQVQQVHAFIRAKLSVVSKKVAENLKILYGGSVKADNAAGLFSLPDVDGGLIGGASLKAEEFVKICMSV